MTIDPGVVGLTYPPTEPYQVGREKIREFAIAIGDANPAYTDVDAAQKLGQPDLVAPPTFAFVLTMKAMSAVMFDPRVGIDFSRIVHGEQSFEAQRPIVAGDELVVRSSIEDVKSSGRHEFLTVRADVHDADDKLVSVTRSVLVSRGTGEAA